MNHRDTAGRGLYKPQEHSRQGIIGTTGTEQTGITGSTERQQAEDYMNHRNTGGKWSYESKGLNRQMVI